MRRTGRRRTETGRIRRTATGRRRMNRTGSRDMKEAREIEEEMDREEARDT